MCLGCKIWLMVRLGIIYNKNAYAFLHMVSVCFNYFQGLKSRKGQIQKEIFINYILLKSSYGII